MATAEKAPMKLRNRPLGLRIGQVVLGTLFRLFFRLYGRWQVLGLEENVPRTGPLLFAASHASYIDPPLGWAAAYRYRRVWGVARADLWNNKFIAYALDCIGVIPVKRGSADRNMIRTALAALELGDAVGIFPEGTRTFDGELNPGQPGIALLSQKMNVPIVPVALLGNYEMFPRGAKKFRRVPLKVVFGKPLTFPPDTPREQIAADVMVAIAALMTANGRPTAPPGPERAALLKAQEDADDRKKEAVRNPGGENTRLRG